MRAPRVEECLNSPADFDMDRSEERMLGRFFPRFLLTCSKGGVPSCFKGEWLVGSEESPPALVCSNA